MKRVSFFSGSALPWLRTINESNTEHIIRRLEQLISTNLRPGRLIMRPKKQDCIRRDAIISAAAEPLSRWDSQSPNTVFRGGFQPWVRPMSINEFNNTEDSALNLQRYIHKHVKSIFVSAFRPAQGTDEHGALVNMIWRPSTIGERYRYEIFTNDGIDIQASLRLYKEAVCPEENEVAFVGGIRPELIRSATKYDEKDRPVGIWYNVHFNPLLNGNHIVSTNRLPKLPEPTANIHFVDACEGEQGDTDTVPLPNNTDFGHRRWDIDEPDADVRNGNFSQYYLGPDGGLSEACSITRPRRACMLLPGGKRALFFADTRFITLDLDNTSHGSYARGTIAPGETVRNIVETWPALHEARFPAVDAILPHPSIESQAYFFFRDKYLLVDINTRQAVSPLTEIAHGWPSLRQVGFTTVDAAALVNSNTVYFFRGSKYVQIQVKSGKKNSTVIDKGHTAKIIKGNWSVLDQIGFSAIDAILPGPSTNEAYLFSGKDYTKIKWNNSRNPTNAIS